MKKRERNEWLERTKPMSEREMDELFDHEEPAAEPQANEPPGGKPTDEQKPVEAADGEEALPEDFRPVVPEPEVRRRTAYYFRRDYPETESPTSTHTVTFAQMERRRKWRARVLYALLLVAVFVLAFVVTAACLMISQQPI